VTRSSLLNADVSRERDRALTHRGRGKSSGKPKNEGNEQRGGNEEIGHKGDNSVARREKPLGKDGINT